MNRRIIRTWLYAPAHVPHVVDKAIRSVADAVVIDLEDAVPAADKGLGRESLRELLGPAPDLPIPVWVRINDPRTEDGRRDLDLLSNLTVAGVRLPKAEDAGIIREVGSLGHPIQLILETAQGMLNARDLAQAHAAVQTLSLGEADLSADLRVTSDVGLAWARGWVVAVARAAGLQSPIQSVFTDVADLEGLIRTTREGAGLGFLGRSVIHPRQIAGVHQAIRPSVEQLENATAIVSAAEAAARAGRTAVLDNRGRFVDPAVVARARVTLDLAVLDDHPTS